MTTEPHDERDVAAAAAADEHAPEETGDPVEEFAAEAEPDLEATEPVPEAAESEPEAEAEAQSDPRPLGPPVDPAAAAELAQELTLVTRALFAQMLPTTSRNAIAGLPGHHAATPGFGAAGAGADTPQTHAAPNDVPPPAPEQAPAATAPEVPAAAAPAGGPAETAPTGSPQTPPGIAPPPLSVPGAQPAAAPQSTPDPQAASPAAAGLAVPGIAVPGAPPPTAPAASAPAAAAPPGAPSATPSIPVPGLGSVPPAAAAHVDHVETDHGGSDGPDEPGQPATRSRPPTPRSLAVLDEVAYLDE